MKKCDERKLEVLYVRQGVRTSRVNTRVRSVSDYFSPRVALEVQRRCIRTAADPCMMTRRSLNELSST